MKKFLLSAICVMAVLFASCKQNDSSDEKGSSDENKGSSNTSYIITGEAKDVRSYTAIVYGEVKVEISEYDAVEYGVLYSEDKNEVESRSASKMWSSVDLLEEAYSVSLSGLSSETKYYYCPFVYLNEKQYKFGEIKSFTTLKRPKPVLGAFSVSSSKQVTFSKGNLQYHPANNKWRFAENQADYVGSANSNISATYNGWIDLFGWGTGNAPTKSSESYSDYQTFVDWGTNQIGADAPNTWRTLSKDEWMYIFYDRPNAESLFALGSVNGVNGTIILPDNWTTPAGVSFVASTSNGLSWRWHDNYYGYYFNSNGTNYGDNTYTSEQWSKMEQAGAVFLPASGSRRGTGVNGVGYYGRYWSSPERNEYSAYYVSFGSSGLCPLDYLIRYDAFSVRLAQDL